MFRRSGFVLQEPELLLGQATPDPEDLPGAHRERPALEHRWTARADCLGLPWPDRPGGPGRRHPRRRHQRTAIHPFPGKPPAAKTGRPYPARPAGRRSPDRVVPRPARGGGFWPAPQGWPPLSPRRAWPGCLPSGSPLLFCPDKTAGCRAAARLAGPLGGRSCETGTASPTSATASAGLLHTGTSTARREANAANSGPPSLKFQLVPPEMRHRQRRRPSRGTSVHAT